MLKKSTAITILMALAYGSGYDFDDTYSGDGYKSIRF